MDPIEFQVEMDQMLDGLKKRCSKNECEELIEFCKSKGWSPDRALAIMSLVTLGLTHAAVERALVAVSADESKPQ